MAVLIELVLARGGTFFIEQPSSSLLMRHRRMQQLLSKVTVGAPQDKRFDTSAQAAFCCRSGLRVQLWQVFRQMVYMGAFGAGSKKPMTIWSNSRAVHLLGKRELDPTTEWPLARVFGLVLFMSMRCSAPWSRESCLNPHARNCLTRSDRITKRYRDASGQPRICGGPDLKASQLAPQICTPKHRGLGFWCCHCLCADCVLQCESFCLRHYPLQFGQAVAEAVQTLGATSSNKEVYLNAVVVGRLRAAAASATDNWDDARLPAVLEYLRGSKYVAVPRLC